MPQLLSIIKKIVFAPVWLLWKAYTGVWWAFTEDQPQTSPAAFGPRTAAAAQNAAFEVIDSRPSSSQRTLIPFTALRAGFITSMIVSLLAAYGLHSAYTHAVMRGSTAMALWAWGTGVVLLTSLWGVKHVARRQSLETDMGRGTQVRVLMGAAGDMGRSAAGALVTTKNATVRAGRGVAGACRTVTTGARRVVTPQRVAAVRNAAINMRERVAGTSHRTATSTGKA